MSQHDSHDDLQPVIEQLRANRPEASPLELDMVKQRVRSRVARQPGRARSATPMKSRLSIILALALGMMLSTAGAGLAISGFAGSSDDASVAQYGHKPGKPNAGGEQVLGEEQQGGPAGQEETLQPTRQAEAGTQETGGGGELPFTGFLAIPVLLGGIALLSTGLVLRRRTGES